MKRLIMFALFFVDLSAFAGPPSDSKVLNYFCELSTQMQWTNEKEVHKWADDIKIYKSGEWPAYMTDEFNLTVEELNGLIQKPRIRVVGSKAEANFIAHLGTADEYLDIEPNASNTEGKWGYFYVYWNNDRVITNGTLSVDIENSPNDTVRRNLIRELLTRSLGLMNISQQYDDSIFYREYSEVTSFSDIDRLVITLLYQPEIKTGMDKSAARKVIRKEKLIDRIRPPDDESDG